MSRSEALAVVGSVLRAGGLTMFTSAAVILGILVLAYNGELVLLKGGTLNNTQWLPFASTLIGVSLYAMSTAMTYRDKWQLRYLPDYWYRAAQAVVYLYIILAIMGQTGLGVTPDAAPQPSPGPSATAPVQNPPVDAPPPASTVVPASLAPTPPTQTPEPEKDPPKPPSSPDFSHWPPNLIGLMVGLFILHVEKAMEGFGQRFEEALTALLGRSLTARTTREKQIERLRDEQRFVEIQRQAELLASQLRSPGAREAIQRRLAAVAEIVRTGSSEELRGEVEKLSWEFEQIKVALREDSQTVAEILGGARRSKKG